MTGHTLVAMIGCLAGTNKISGIRDRKFLSKNSVADLRGKFWPDLGPEIPDLRLNLSPGFEAENPGVRQTRFCRSFPGPAWKDQLI